MSHTRTHADALRDLLRLYQISLAYPFVAPHMHRPPQTACRQAVFPHRAPLLAHHQLRMHEYARQRQNWHMQVREVAAARGRKREPLSESIHTAQGGDRPTYWTPDALHSIPGKASKDLDVMGMVEGTCSHSSASSPCQLCRRDGLIRD